MQQLGKRKAPTAEPTAESSGAPAAAAADTASAATKASAAWRHRVERFEQDLQRESESKEGYKLLGCFQRNVKAILSPPGLGLSKDELELLLRCTTVDGSAGSMDEAWDVRDFEIDACVFAVDGSSCVQLKHSYHNRCRSTYSEHSGSVHFRIGEQPTAGAAKDGQGWQKAWTLSLRNTGTHKFVYAERRRFALTKKAVKAIRAALFPKGAAHSGISAKVDDYSLMRWLLAAAGYDVHGGLESPVNIKHSCDGWEGVRLRRICNASTEKDATWVEHDFEKDISEAKEWEWEHADDSDYDDDFF